MKKLINSFIVIALCLTTNIFVFSQKSINRAKLESPKTELKQAEFKLSEAAAFTDGNGVYLRWSTQGESDVLSFNVYRTTGKETILVNKSLIAGGYLRSRSTNYYGDYSFFDPNGELGNSYTIEAVSLDGSKKTIGQVISAFVSNLADVAGQTSNELKISAESEPTSVQKSEITYPAEYRKQFEENILPADLPTHRWVVSQPGARISVKSQGLFRVTRTELQNAGFDVNAASNLWQLYVDGKEQAFTVGANDSYIEFLGEGIDTTESDTKVYYLIVGAQNGKRIESRFLRPLAGNILAKGFSQTFTKKERSFYTSSIFNGEGENYFGSSVISGGSTLLTTYNYNLKGINRQVTKGSFEVSLQGLTFNPHQVEVLLNDEVVGVMSWQGKVLKSQRFDIGISQLQDGANTIKFRATGGSSDITLMDYAKFNYSRKYEVDQNQLSFYTINYHATNLTGFTTPNIRVFDLSYPDAVTEISNVRIENDNGVFNAVLPSHRGRIMMAVEDSAIKSVASVTANTPSTLTTVNHNAEIIIVTHKDWMTQANTWANYRINQGLTVEVVNIEDIFDEYSFGSQSTSAMTSFFQYAKNNWQTPPNYILLIGDATYDFRNYGNGTFLSYVPTRLVDTLYEETGSDEALCDFNSDGLAELAVGRIPARTSTEVTTMFNKMVSFEANLTGVMDRGALFVADQPIGYDFEGVNTRVASQLPPEMPKNFIARSNPNARSLVMADLNTGRYLVNYSGHGSALFWAQSNFYHKNDFAVMTNGNERLSVFTLLTCLNGYFVNTTLDSFAETGMKTPNNGAVIMWASSGETTPDIQEIMATRFYQQITLGNMNKMGDLVRDAKQAINGGRDVRLSWTLFGDPTTKIR